MRKRLWPELSKLIRKRDGRCMFAGYFGRKCGGRFAAAHILPKGTYPLLELLPSNIVCACYVCHIHGWHKDPVAAGEWIAAHFSTRPREWEELQRLKLNSLERKGMLEADIRAEWKAHGLC